MATGHYIGLDNSGIKLIRAVSSSTGSADADKIPRLNANGQIDVSMLPTSAQGGVEARDASNVVLGQATILREGNNIQFSISGSTLTISSLANPAQALFETRIPRDVYYEWPAWTPI